MDGIQRLSKMLEGQKDKSLIKIVNYLMLQKDMDLQFLKEEKNLKDMAKYIRKLAKNYQVDGVAMIENDEVYKWAKNYFLKSNEELGIEGKVERKEQTKKNTESSELGSIFEMKQENTIEQISLFA